MTTTTSTGDTVLPATVPVVDALTAAFDEARHFVSDAIHAAGHADVRAASDCVFRFMDDESGVRLSVLAERAHMTKQALAEHVDHLEATGYVERVPDPTDRRAKLVRPTAMGVECMHVARRALVDLGEDLRAELGDDGVAALLEGLHAMRRILSERSP